MLDTNAPDHDEEAMPSQLHKLRQNNDAGLYDIFYLSKYLVEAKRFT